MQILREHNVSRAPEFFGSKRTTDSINTCVYFAQFPQRCQPIFGALRRQKCRKIVNISRISARKTFREKLRDLGAERDILRRRRLRRPKRTLK